MFKSTKKFKNRMFAMMPTIDQTGQGISLIVLEENKKNVSGLRFVVGDCLFFQMPVNDFEILLKNKKIELVSELPEEIVKETKQIYLQKKKMVS